MGFVYTRPPNIHLRWVSCTPFQNISLAQGHILARVLQVPLVLSWIVPTRVAVKNEKWVLLAQGHILARVPGSCSGPKNREYHTWNQMRCRGIARSPDQDQMRCRGIAISPACQVVDSNQVSNNRKIIIIVIIVIIIIILLIIIIIAWTVELACGASLCDVDAALGSLSFSLQDPATFRSDLKKLRPFACLLAQFRRARTRNNTSSLIYVYSWVHSLIYKNQQQHQRIPKT